MDIRDIKVEVPQVEDFLKAIFKYGTEQAQAYRSVENIPEGPIDINTSKNQAILKDFIGRVTEELAEGHESLIEVTDILEQVGFNKDLLDTDQIKAILNGLQNANEEQADALGFFVTLFNLANISAEDIYSYYSVKGAGFDHSIDLSTLMSYGVSLQHRHKDVAIVHYSIFDPELVESVNQDYEKVLKYTPGFHSVSERKIRLNEIRLWLVVYYLNLARNVLKNRPWKQTQVMSKEDQFQEYLVLSFIYYLGYLATNNFTPEGLFELFYRKQQLNLWRISTNY